MTMPTGAYLAQLAVIQAHDTTARLGRLSAPTLVLAGEQDILIPTALSHDLHELIPPWVAAIRFVAPSIVLGCLMQFIDPGDAGSVLPTLGIFGVVVMYFVTNLALAIQYLRLRRDGVAKNPLLWVVVPIIGMLVLLIPGWGNLRPGQGGIFDWMPALSILLIAVGVVYTIVLAVTRPAVLAAAPALLEGAEALATDPERPAVEQA